MNQLQTKLLRVLRPKSLFDNLHAPSLAGDLKIQRAAHRFIRNLWPQDVCQIAPNRLPTGIAQGNQARSIVFVESQFEWHVASLQFKTRRENDAGGWVPPLFRLNKGRVPGSPQAPYGGTKYLSADLQYLSKDGR